VAGFTYNNTKRGYLNLWKKAEPDPHRIPEIRARAQVIIDNKERYQAVEFQTGVPWFWIGAIHYRENANRFNGALHNGDKVIGNGRLTYRVPAGRGPFATWEDSAYDAIKSQGLHLIEDWPIERCLFEAEKYNGTGYFGRENSPYVWAGTTLSDETGKYVSDGRYDPNAPEKQLGVAALIGALVDMDADAYNYLFGELEDARNGPPREAPQPPSQPDRPPVSPPIRQTVGALTPEMIAWLSNAPASLEIAFGVRVKKN